MKKTMFVECYDYQFDCSEEIVDDVYWKETDKLAGVKNYIYVTFEETQFESLGESVNGKKDLGNSTYY